MTVTNLSELADHIDAEVRDALRIPALDACRAIAQEAGIRRARRALAEAPDRLAEAQAAYREAQAVEAAAKERYGQALLEAEWTLDGQLHKDGNKTYRWIECECIAVDAGPAVVKVRTPEGREAVDNCAICAGAGKFRRFMLADDVKSWKAAEAAKAPAVVAATLDLREAEEATAGARDAVTVADKRFSACRADLEAACAELNALAMSLAAKGA